MEHPPRVCCLVLEANLECVVGDRQVLGVHNATEPIMESEERFWNEKEEEQGFRGGHSQRENTVDLVFELGEGARGLFVKLGVNLQQIQEGVVPYDGLLVVDQEIYHPPEPNLLTKFPFKNPGLLLLLLILLLLGELRHADGLGLAVNIKALGCQEVVVSRQYGDEGVKEKERRNEGKRKEKNRLCTNFFPICSKVTRR